MTDLRRDSELANNLWRWCLSVRTDLILKYLKKKPSGISLKWGSNQDGKSPGQAVQELHPGVGKADFQFWWKEAVCPDVVQQFQERRCQRCPELEWKTSKTKHGTVHFDPDNGKTLVKFFNWHSKAVISINTISSVTISFHTSS